MHVVVWQADGEPFYDGRGYGSAVVNRLHKMGHTTTMVDQTSPSFTGSREHEDCDLVILTGGSTPVHRFGSQQSWMTPALRRTRELLHSAQSGDGPAVLGFCLGSQMIAAAASQDVNVVRQDGVMEAGMLRLESLVGDGIATPIESSFAFHYHYIDQKSIEAVGGTILTRTEDCPVAEFVFPGPVVGSQLHPEIGPQEGELLLMRNADLIASTGGDVDVALQATRSAQSEWSGERFEWLVSMAMERRSRS